MAGGETKFDVIDYVGGDVHKSEQATFTLSGAPSVGGTSLRMVEAADAKHLGKSAVTFMDSHAEVRMLRKEKMRWKLVFDPLDPVATY